MATKYWRLHLKGERSLDEIQAAVGQGGGLVARVHIEAGETHVYFAADESTISAVSKAFKRGSAPTEVSADEVTRFG